MTQLRSRTLALFALLVGLSPLAAQEDAGTKKTDAVKPAKTRYAIVETAGKPEIIDTAELGARRKQVAEENKQAAAAWKDARDAAKKNKESFDQKKPAARKLKVLANNLASEDAAAKALAAIEAKNAKKAGAKTKKAKAPRTKGKKKTDKDG